MADPIRPAALAALVAAALAGSAADAAPRATPPLPGPAGAARAIPVAALDRRVQETTDLPTWELQHLRRRMLAHRWISFKDMRRLADHGDGLAAFRYGKRLLGQDDPGLRSAAALYFATAALTGRDYAVGPLVRLLDQPDIDFTDKRLAHLENAMRNMAVAGDATAAEALARFYETGHPFGYHPERARSLLVERAEAADPEAALKLATQEISRGDKADRDLIDQMLSIAAGSDNLGLRAAARTLETRRAQSEDEDTSQ